jgi:hypothetical protein
MTPTDPQLAQDLFDVASAISAAKRPLVAQQLARLQALVGSTTDLFVDRRKTTWAPGGKARNTVLTRAKPISPPKKPSCQVSWRQGGFVVCTLDEAAAAVRKKPATLSVYLSRGRYQCVVDDDVVTVERL